MKAKEPIDLEGDGNMDFEEVEGNNDENEDEIPVATIEVKQPKGSKQDPQDLPVDNAREVPLFGESDKRGLRSISYLAVIKVDQPGTGYKGKIPISATKQTIYELYGNGLYNIEAYNHRNVKIREILNERIDIPENEKADDSVRASGHEDSATSLLIKSRHIAHKEEIQRTERLATVASDVIREQSKQHSDLMIQTSKETIERDRAHMKGVNDAQLTFMSTMLAAQNAGFQQMMTMLQTGHSHTMDILLSDRKDKEDPTEKLVKLVVLVKSLMDDKIDDGPPWLQALDKGGSMLTQLVALGGMQSPKQIAPSTQNGNSTPAKPPTKKTKLNNPKGVKITKDEAEKIIKLKELLDAKGIDFSEMLADTIVAEASYTDSEPEEGEKLEESEDSETTDVATGSIMDK